MENVDMFEAAVAAMEAASVQEQPAEVVVEEASEHIEPEQVESVEEEAPESEEAKEEEKEEEAKEEEEKEEEKPDEKAILLERRERQVQHMKKKLAVEADKVRALSTKLKDFEAQDIPRAIEIAAARREGKTDKVLELIGLNTNEVIDYFAKIGALKDPEAIKEKMAVSKLEEARREEQQKRTDIAMMEFAQQAKTLINKHAEKLPILSTLGQEGIDQARQIVIDKWRNDPQFQAKMKLEADKRGIEPNFEFCAKHVLPDLEKQLKKKYEPIVKVLSKVQPAPVEKESPKAKEKKVDEKKPTQKVEVKQEEKAKPKPIVKGSSGTRVETIRRPMSEEDKLVAAVQAMTRSGKG